MSASDNLLDKQISITAGAFKLQSITPSDTTDLPNTARGVHVTANSGLVYVTTAGMTTGTSAPIYVAQGGLFPALITRIWATGTTATGIVAAY